MVAIGLLIAFILTQALAGALVISVGGDLKPPAGTVDNTFVRSVILVEAVVFVAALAFIPSVGGWRRLTEKPGGSVFAERLLRGLGQLLPVLFIVVVPGVIYAALSSTRQVVNGDLLGSTIALLIALSIIISFAEELWFRGLIMTALGAAARPWFSILFSAIIFGLPHALGGDRAALMNAGGVILAVGIPFAVVRLQSGSFTALVIGHSVIDIWAFLHTGSVSAKGDPRLIEMVVSLIVPAIIAAAYLAWFKKRESAQVTRVTD